MEVLGAASEDWASASLELGPGSREARSRKPGVGKPLWSWEPELESRLELKAAWSREAWAGQQVLERRA